MIKRLVRMGNPLLNQKAKPVTTFGTPELNRLIEDLFDTMKANGGVGIAAPQIGIDLQVIVFGFDHATRYPHAASVSETVLINPTYTPINDEIYEDWEGCLSVRGLRGLTPRYKTIRYKGYDINGNEIKKEATGFHARLVQHEIDHLNGALFVHRITNLNHFGFEDEIQLQMKNMGTKLA